MTDSEHAERIESIQLSLKTGGWIDEEDAAILFGDLRRQVRDHEARADDVKRLTRMLDVAMHGEATNAAPQASLCDLVPLAAAARDSRIRLHKEVIYLCARIAEKDARLVQLGDF